MVRQRKRRQETRKKAKRIRKNQSRRYKRHTNKNHRHKRQKQQGGNYAEDVTDNEVDNMPVTDKAVISIAGQPPMSVDAFKRHAEYRDFQGEEQ